MIRDYQFIDQQQYHTFAVWMSVVTGYKVIKRPFLIILYRFYGYKSVNLLFRIVFIGISRYKAKHT